MGKGNNKRTKEDRFYAFLEEHAITINAFMKRCLGIKSHELMKGELTHRDLVKIFPNLQRTSYDVILDDPSMVSTGEVVIVMDANANIIPYFNTDFLELEDLYDFYKKQAISIKRFIEICISSMSNDELNSIKFPNKSLDKLTHQDLIVIFPNLKKFDCNFIIDNPEILKTGEVVVIEDATGEVVPYINPLFVKSEEMDSVMDESWNDNPEEWTFQTEIVPVQSYDLKSMSNYELETLMKFYTASGQWHSYEVVRRELTSRDTCQHANKVSKRKALERSQKRIKDDEY